MSKVNANYWGVVGERGCSLDARPDFASQLSDNKIHCWHCAFLFLHTPISDLVIFYQPECTSNMIHLGSYSSAFISFCHCPFQVLLAQCWEQGCVDMIFLNLYCLICMLTNEIVCHVASVFNLGIDSSTD